MHVHAHTHTYTPVQIYLAIPSPQKKHTHHHHFPVTFESRVRDKVTGKGGKTTFPLPRPQSGEGRSRGVIYHLHWKERVLRRELPERERVKMR